LWLQLFEDAEQRAGTAGVIADDPVIRSDLPDAAAQ